MSARLNELLELATQLTADETAELCQAAQGLIARRSFRRRFECACGHVRESAGQLAERCESCGATVVAQKIRSGG